MSIACLVASLALGCADDAAHDHGGPDAADGLDGGDTTDAMVDADATDEADARPRDSGDAPDDAEPMPDAASEDGSMPSPPYASCVRWERDVDGDGDVDTTIAFFYDDADRLVIEEHDMGSASGVFDGADGTADYRQTTTYSDDGDVALLADDWDADGNEDLVTRYDEDGRKTEEVWDVGDDGETLDRTTYEYRQDGELSIEARDSDGDGEANSRTTYVYDSGDMLLLRIEEDADLSDELIDKVISNEYDGQGRKTKEETFEGEVLVSRVAFSYDGDGNLIRREQDDGIDGVPDAIEQWTFDAGARATYELDKDGDGLVDERETFDAAGRVVTDERYDDGVLDVTTAYEYDEGGNVLVERAESGDAVLLSLKQYGYDESERPVQLTVDSDGNGTDDLVTRWTYDAEGNLLTVEERRSEDADAPFVVTEGYTYDEDGRLIEITYDRDANGTPDGFERRFYEC